MRMHAEIAKSWLLLVVLSLAGCQSAEPLSLVALRPPLGDVPGATRMEVKSEVDVRKFADDTDVLSVRALRQQQVIETGYFKYHLSDSRAYKLKAIIYASTEARERAWNHQYPEFVRAAGEARAWGDEGFVVPGRMAAFALGRLSVQVDAAGTGLQPGEMAERVLQRARRLQQ